MRWVDGERSRATRWNADDAELERALVDVVRRHARCVDGTLPWHGALRTRRLYAGLVSFVDDFAGPFPSELFPRERVDELRRALRAAAGDGVLTIDEQLAVALGVTDGGLLAASVLLHAVTRWLARDRDGRALGRLGWDERLRDASWIAPFAPHVAGNGDPAGDTYHYWANFTVGIHVELERSLAPRALGAMFHAGPVLMSAIREGLFGSTLFAGAHALCDRQGMRHGRAVVRALRRRAR